jgi:hypothetical protein
MGRLQLAINGLPIRLDNGHARILPEEVERVFLTLFARLNVKLARDFHVTPFGRFQRVREMAKSPHPGKIITECRQRRLHFGSKLISG